MDATGTDRKVWTALETSALISLKGDMKLKFQTMKRNRVLWVELSDKLRLHYGHDRTAAQCAVRWKNIMSAYKDSRDDLTSLRDDPKLCPFFKDVEAVLGDNPLVPERPVGKPQTKGKPAPGLQKRERPREKSDHNMVGILNNLVEKVDEQAAAIARIETMLAKRGAHADTRMRPAAASVVGSVTHVPFSTGAVAVHINAVLSPQPVDLSTDPAETAPSLSALNRAVGDPPGDMGKVEDLLTVQGQDDGAGVLHSASPREMLGVDQVLNSVQGGAPIRLNRPSPRNADAEEVAELDPKRRKVAS